MICTNFSTYFPQSKPIQRMKNRNIVHAHQEAEIYREYYRPSINLLRFAKSILGVFIFGSPTVANSYAHRKKIMK